MFSRLTGSNLSRATPHPDKSHVAALPPLILCMSIICGCQQAAPSRAEIEDRTEPTTEIADASIADISIEGLSPPASIELLLEAADNKPAGEKFQLRRQALELSIDHETPVTAQRRMATLERQYPGNTYRVQMEILRQRFLLARGRSRDVLANIDSIGLLATAEEKIQLMELQAVALEQAGFAVESVQLRITLDKLYSDNEQARQQDNDRQLWRSLMRLSPTVISSRISETPDTFSGWLELAYLSRQHPYNPALLNKTINDWSLRHATHPAHRHIIENIRQRQITIGNHPRHIALLLPLSGKLQAIGQAIRDGFLANHLEFEQRIGISTTIDIYDTESNPEIARLSLQRANESSADFIVGPLDKAAVAAVVSSDEAAPPPNPLSAGPQDTINTGPVPSPAPLLVLNQTPPEWNSNHKVYQFTLAPESEAIEAANRAHLFGQQHAMVIVPDNAWGNRLYEAFAAAYRQLGGTVAAQYRYQRGTPDHSQGIQQGFNLHKSRFRHQRIKQLLGQNIRFTPSLRRDIDLIFLAASSQEARQIKAQLKFFYADHIPVYATSHIFTGKPDAIRNKDLDGIYFTDMPWILNDKPAPGSLSKALQDNWPAQATNQYARFHALGADAFRLLPLLEWLTEHQDERINGETGKLSLSNNGIVERESSWAVFRDGVPSTQAAPENQL